MNVGGWGDDINHYGVCVDFVFNFIEAARRLKRTDQAGGLYPLSHIDQIMRLVSSGAMRTLRTQEDKMRCSVQVHSNSECPLLH